MLNVKRAQRWFYECNTEVRPFIRVYAACAFGPEMSSHSHFQALFLPVNAIKTIPNEKKIKTKPSNTSHFPVLPFPELYSMIELFPGADAFVYSSLLNILHALIAFYCFLIQLKFSHVKCMRGRYALC